MSDNNMEYDRTIVVDPEMDDDTPQTESSEDEYTETTYQKRARSNESSDNHSTKRREYTEKYKLPDDSSTEKEEIVGGSENSATPLSNNDAQSIKKSLTQQNNKKSSTQQNNEKSSTQQNNERSSTQPKEVNPTKEEENETNPQQLKNSSEEINDSDLMSPEMTSSYWDAQANDNNTEKTPKHTSAVTDMQPTFRSPPKLVETKKPKRRKKVKSKWTKRRTNPGCATQNNKESRASETETTPGEKIISSPPPKLDFKGFTPQEHEDTTTQSVPEVPTTFRSPSSIPFQEPNSPHQILHEMNPHLGKKQPQGKEIVNEIASPNGGTQQ